MQRHQPGRDEVHDVMEHIRVRDAVDGGEQREGEEQERGGVAGRVGCGARDHFAARQGLAQEDEGHDAEDVVVRRKGRQPVHGEVVNPDDEDGAVDGEQPEHEDQDGVGVVVEVGVGGGTGLAGEAEGFGAGGELDEAGDEVGELVCDEGRDH